VFAHNKIFFRAVLSAVVLLPPCFVGRYTCNSFYSTLEKGQFYNESGHYRLPPTKRRPIQTAAFIEVTTPGEDHVFAPILAKDLENTNIVTADLITRVKGAVMHADHSQSSSTNGNHYKNNHLWCHVWNGTYTILLQDDTEANNFTWIRYFTDHDEYVKFTCAWEGAFSQTSSARVFYQDPIFKLEVIK
jgi:hypothetical protein